MKSDTNDLPRAVVDTNILVSGLSETSTPPVQIIDAWQKGRFVLLSSPLILDELEDVLSRPAVQIYFPVDTGRRKRYLKQLRRKADVVPDAVQLDVVVSDPDDNFILACALLGEADYIVTGDKKHLLPLKEYEGIQIVTAREFLERLREI